MGHGIHGVRTDTVTEVLLKEAQPSLELAQGRYSLGLASIVEITQEELNLTQAKIESVSAKAFIRAPTPRCNTPSALLR